MAVVVACSLYSTSSPDIFMHNACSFVTSYGGARSVVNVSQRNSTFIGIRNYFKRLSRQTEPRSRHFSSSVTTHAATAAHSKPFQYELPTDVYFSENSPLAPSARFDWRLRATSRRCNKNESLQKQGGPRAYAKRIVPPYAQVQPGNPLCEEIQAYHDQ